MSLFSVVSFVRPLRKVFLSLLLSAAALLPSCVSQAQTVFGDFKVVGTGADAGISFEFLANQSPLTQGLLAIFSFVSCTVPAGESCGQVDYSATGGQIRLTTNTPGGLTNRTWNFPSFLHTGVYIGQTGTGLEPGYVLASGADATAGNPQSNTVDSTFQFPIEVTVNDSTPSYESGMTVTFTAPDSGPSASLPDSGLATTDSTGRARISPTANGIPGAYQITATATVAANTFQTSFVAANVNTANATGACQVTTANDDFSVGSLRYQVAACGKGGTITFASGVTMVNVAIAQDIPLTQDLTIDGGGSGVTINGNGLSRLFFVSGGTITLRNLTLQGGAAAGGTGGAGSAGFGGGGGAAGMGGAIFVNAGSLVINNVTLTRNQAGGGSGGSDFDGFIAGGGGGVGGPGGSTASGTNGNGGSGGDFGSSGGAGAGVGNSGNGQGDGAGGGNGGPGAFGGGGSGGAVGANGGFGGGGGGGTDSGGTGGTFGGSGGVDPPNGGGYGGAALGGAIFMRDGTLSLTNAAFSSNSATAGVSQAGGSNGQGKGGALYVSSTASAVSTTSLAALFSNNSATNAGTGTACNTVSGAGALDTNDICGILTGPATHFSVSAPASATAGGASQITVTALDANNNVVTGYAGTVHLTSTDATFVNSTGDSTLTHGVGAFSVGLKTAGEQTMTATDTVNESITGTSNGILVSPGPAAQLDLSAPLTTDAGESLVFTVNVFDTFGNTVTGGTLHFTSSDPAAILPADSTLTNGTGSFGAMLNTTGLQTITVTDTTNGIMVTSVGIAVSIPGLVVISTADSGPGTLRAALATAAADGSANITFDPATFATPQTITLTSGTLNIPSNTTIAGATTGSGAALQNLVTVSGGGSSSVFTVNSGVTGASIHNLTITEGFNTQGGGIMTSGSLTVTGSTFLNNSASGVGDLGGPIGGGGGAIFINSGALAISNSTFSGNSSAPGGAISISSGNVTIEQSTFAGNSALFGTAGGAIFINSGPVTIAGSTFSGNSAASGGGVFNNGTLTATNTIMAGNMGSNCVTGGGGNSCPTNGMNGNVIGVANIGLAPLGNYGGPTQTLIPLPGSSAICAGLQAKILSGVTTDQRGLPNTNASYPGFSAGAACVDAGAAQTNYALSFTRQPSNTESGVSMLPAPLVTLTESGNGFTASAITIPLTLTGSGTLSGGSATTSAGLATYSNLKVSATGSETLTATLPLNPNLSTPLSLAVASNSFDVGSAVTATQAIAAEVLTFSQSAVSFTPVAGSGGTAPLSYSLSPALPAGLSFSVATGAIMGTPTATSPLTTYTVTVTDAASATATAEFSLTVSPATPVLQWSAPPSIAYGTALSANQLDATASVSGAFAYNPPVGTALPVGMHTLTATFTPADTTDYRTPPPVTATLNVNSATLNVTANSATRVYGSANPAFTGTVTGAFNGDALTESFSSAATATSSVGSYPIVPSVTGTNLADYSVQSTNGTLSIRKAASATTLSASSSSLTAGQSLTLTATVADATPNSTGTPTGTVSFFDGSTLLGTAALSGGTASYASASLTPSVSHALTAMYSGDVNFIASSTGAAISVPVAALDFTLTISGAQSQTAVPGGAATYSFKIAPEYGAYPGPVTFSVAGLPPGAVASFSPASISSSGGPQSVVLTVQTASPSAKTGHPFEREAPLAFAVLLLPLLGRRRVRHSLLSLMIVGALLAGVVSISGCGAMDGFNAQAVKNYTVTVTAASAGIQHSSDVNLNVQ
jgi:hypothetical protein